MTTPANQNWSKRGNLKGQKGDTGSTPTITVGTVTSGSAPGVTRRGTDDAPILDFVLQSGPKGENGVGVKGDTGPRGNRIDAVALATAGTVPDQADSIVGDLLLDTNTGDLYKRTA